MSSQKMPPLSKQDGLNGLEIESLNNTNTQLTRDGLENGLDGLVFCSFKVESLNKCSNTFRRFMDEKWIRNGYSNHYPLNPSYPFYIQNGFLVLSELDKAKKCKSILSIHQIKNKNKLGVVK